MNLRMWPMAAALAVCVCAHVAYATVSVWTTPLTQRVLRDDVAPAGATVTAKVSAGRNECRGFQILVRSDLPLSGVTLDKANLVNTNGVSLRAEVKLFRQHQFHIAAGSYRNAEFKAGWYPDALVPFADPVTNLPLSGGRVSAAPFDLPANETHGFWVDIRIPVDAKAGRYRGTFRVRSGSTKIADIPVIVTVWNFALPLTPALQTAFGSPAVRMKAYYARLAAAGIEAEPKDWTAVENQCARLLSEHRINAYPSPSWTTPRLQSDGSFRIADQQVSLLRQFVDTYHINAIQVPRPQGFIGDPVAEQTKLRAWLAAIDAAATAVNRPGVTWYVYLMDEPNDERAYRQARQWGKAIRDAKTVVKVLVTEQTQAQNEAWGDLYGAVDIWCPLFSLFDPDSAAKRQALGEAVWGYTAMCQGKAKTPWWQTDYPLLNYRVPAWIGWRYRMTGLLYWGSMAYWDQTTDPWADPTTYRAKENQDFIYNGDGSLVYPARAVGYDGIVPSLRLKAMRDSIQDYEYLALLDLAGKRSEAEAIVAPLAESFFKWDPDPAAYEAAREQLAALLVAAKKQP